MFNFFIMLFIGFNAAFSLFDGAWMLIGIKTGNYKYAVLFGAASFLHAHFCTLAWNKLHEKESDEDTPKS